MSNREIIEGKLQGNERGYAFLIPSDGRTEDFFIPHSDLKDAMHGDYVLAERTNGGGNRTTARVLKIVERGISELVGTYYSHKKGGFIVPDERKYFKDVFVPFGKGVRAKTGDKVVVKILFYPKRQSPEGIITKVLGRQFEKKAELKSILFSYKLPERFSKELLEYADKIDGQISSKDLKGRLDLRNALTFTIDGEDAKDFDDAVSIERQANGYNLGVHIADVSHYVKMGDVIDKEAFNRGTSVYFPEQVIPMLPNVLCNDLCSLKEGVDRLTLSCIMTIDNKGNVKNYEITPSVINSSSRTTYNIVQKIIDGDKKIIKENKKIVDSVLMMNELSDVLSKKREEQGNIDLDVKESAIRVDDNGEILVAASKQLKSQKIIEEFMILANVTVAEYMFFLEKPFIYRVHEKPSDDKLQTFYEFLNGLGINVKRKKDEIYSKDFKQILKKVENTPFFTLVNRVMLRSMQKAKYSDIDVGHFGLSEKHYCHFTSPIRRYPDLMIHRIIKDFIAGNNDVDNKYAGLVADAARQSSVKERNATDAERAVDDYYKLLYISGFVGDEFDGIISGVTAFGVFVELECGVEGLIKSENIGGKRKLNYDEKNFTLSVGENKYKLGQPAKIKVAGVNLADRRAEFVFA